MGPSKQRCNIWSTAGSLTLEIVLPNKEKQLINKDGYLPSCWNSLFRLISPSVLQCLDWVRPRRLEATAWRNKCTELFRRLSADDQEKETNIQVNWSMARMASADSKHHYQIILLRTGSEPIIDWRLDITELFTYQTERMNWAEHSWRMQNVVDRNWWQCAWWQNYIAPNKIFSLSCPWNGKFQPPLLAFRRGSCRDQARQRCSAPARRRCSRRLNSSLLPGKRAARRRR